MKELHGVDELNEFIWDNYHEGNAVLLYFGAKWCGPCKDLKKRLDDIDTINMMPKLAVGHMDIDDDENEMLVKRYKITQLPTQLFIKLNKDKVVENGRIEGYDFTKLKLEYDVYFA